MKVLHGQIHGLLPPKGGLRWSNIEHGAVLLSFALVLLVFLFLTLQYVFLLRLTARVQTHRKDECTNSRSHAEAFLMRAFRSFTALFLASFLSRA